MGAKASEIKNMVEDWNGYEDAQKSTSPWKDSPLQMGFDMEADWTIRPRPQPPRKAY